MKFLDLLMLVKLLVVDRQRLVLENVALRHQLTVLKRSVTRPKIHDSDRLFWIFMMRMHKEWKDAVHFVKPDTVIKWHRRGFRYYWKRKSKGKPGRPPISMSIIYLIRRMSTENVTWGAPRISAELALLGHLVRFYGCKVHGQSKDSRFVAAMGDIHSQSHGRDCCL